MRKPNPTKRIAVRTLFVIGFALAYYFGAVRWLQSAVEEDSAFQIRLISYLAPWAIDRKEYFRDATPLCNAVNKNKAQAVAALIEGGANPNQGCQWMGALINFASFHGSTELVSALVKGGADVNRIDEGFENSGVGTALHAAAGGGSAKRVHIILDAGGDPNIFVKGYGTPLHMAVQFAQDSKERPEIVRMLLRAGADPTIRDAAGKTPVERAKQYALDQKATAYRRWVEDYDAIIAAFDSVKGADQN